MSRNGLPSVLLSAFGTLLLLVLAIALGTVLAKGTGVNVPTIPEELEPTGQTATQLSSLPIPQARPADYYAAITERPLFSSERRPTPQDRPTPATGGTTVPETVIAPEPEPAAKEVTLPHLRLLGTMIGQTRSTALIQVDGSEPDWVADGDAILGWTVALIFADSVKLSRESEFLQLELYPQ